MPSSGMLRRLAIVRTKVPEEHTASIIKGKRIGDLGRMLGIISNRRTLRRNSRERRLLIIANVVPSSQILVSLIMEVLLSS
jgi:hypothetical protein